MERERVDMTILETYPDATPKALRVGSDDMIHFTDAFGQSWCESMYSDYYLVTLEEELDLFETVDDKPISEFCPGCKEGCDEEWPQKDSVL